MTSPTVLRAALPDVIALAFYTIGYRPRESLVLVGMHGPRHRVGLSVRVDLPPPSTRAATVRHAADALWRNGEDAVLGLVVSDLPAQPHPPKDPAGVRLPHRALVRELRREVRRSGRPLIDVLAVGAERWWSHFCRDAACCGVEGHPLDEALTGRVAVAEVLAGRVLAASETDLDADVRDGPPLPPGDAPPGVARDPSAALEYWRALLAGRVELTAGGARLLALLMADKWFRDALMLTLIPGHGDQADAVLWGGDVHDGRSVDATAPEPALRRRGDALLAALVRAAPSGARADPLAVLAWLAWWAGYGVRGRRLVDLALSDDPDHVMAGLVGRLMDLGIAPRWVAAEPE